MSGNLRLVKPELGNLEAWRKLLELLASSHALAPEVREQWAVLLDRSFYLISKGEQAPGGGV